MSTSTEKQRAYQRALRRQRVDSGLCARCGKQPPSEERRHCADCLRAQSVALRRRRNQTEGLAVFLARPMPSGEDHPRRSKEERA